MVAGMWHRPQRGRGEPGGFVEAAIHADRFGGAMDGVARKSLRGDEHRNEPKGAEHHDYYPRILATLNT